MTDILILYFVLIALNCLTEYLFHKMMLSMEVVNKKYRFYHIMCAAFRILWFLLCAWLVFPMPVLLIGLFLLLYLNVLPYRDRKFLINNFTMIVYLVYISLLMTVIGCAGLLDSNLDQTIRNTDTRAIILSIAFVFFNISCVLMLQQHPDFLWKADYDRFKAVIYTRFLLMCIIYHIIDSIMLTMYHISRTNYLLLVSGDILILILIFNFLRYNYVFENTERLRKEYEESEILIAQQYFEKETLKKLSEFDSLTNSYNRREISSIMMEHIRTGHKLVCVFIDLDGLKRINDKYGHTFGDLMLKRFSDACSLFLKKDNYLARIGGDEFLLVFLDQEVSFVEQQIKELQLKLLEADEEKEKIRFSYGISNDEDSVDNYISLADPRMYECKNRKRCENP